MLKQDFKVEIPESLIASEPLINRTSSRLLVVDSHKQLLMHSQFKDLIQHLRPEDCLIFNNTKVIAARLHGHKTSGGKVEILVERVIPQDFQDECIAQLRASNTPKIGNVIEISLDFSVEVIGREGEFFRLRAIGETPLLEQIEKYGSMPLPPYIKRQANEVDQQRYQTVFAEKQGAVAAPTAGLHFDETLMNQIREKGISIDFVTLHVGAGTFSPIRVDNVLEHTMHSEWFEVPQSVVDLIETTRRNKGRVIAVGTTSVRCLESAAQSGMLKPSRGETNIFIYPGYQFRVVDALVTNFHLSESTLLMLVCAFAGKSLVLQAYRTAVELSYRFFSYGDAMFFENRVQSPQASNT